MSKKTYYITSILTAIILSLNGYHGVMASSGISALAGQNTYYVSTTGDDANNCTQALPCKTIARGINAAQTGDTVMVLAGVYHEYVYIDKSITLLSSGAVIDGTNATGEPRDGLISVFADNVKVSGFTIMNAVEYGLANFGNYGLFSNNIIHNTQGPGIWMRNGKYNTFENNELYYTVLQNSAGFNGSYYTCNPNASYWPSAINPWGTAGSNTWRGNNVHDNCGEGIVTYTGDIVENNIFMNNWSVEIYIVADRTTVRNNTIIDTRPYAPRGFDQSWRSVPAGISIGDEETCLTDNNSISGNSITGSRYGVSFYAYISCSGVKNSLIENNTISNVWEYGLRILSGAHTNSIIRNNTIKLASSKPLTIQNGSGFTVSGNVFSSNMDVFEWNGKTFNFAGWNAVVPGNFWGTAGSTSPTSTNLPAATATSASTSTTMPTATAVAASPTPTYIVPSPTPTQIVQPTIQPTNTPIPPSPAPTDIVVTPTEVPQEPTQASAATVYDDKDSALVYSSGWADLTNRKSYNGSYKLANGRHPSVTLNFTGQSFTIIYTSDSHYKNMDVYVDNVYVGTINQRSSRASYQQSWTYPGQLSYGNHTLKLEVNNKRGSYSSLDAIIVQ